MKDQPRETPSANLGNALVERWLNQIGGNGPEAMLSFAEPYLRRYVLPQAVSSGAHWRSLLTPRSIAWMHPAALWEASRLLQEQGHHEDGETVPRQDLRDLVGAWKELSHLWRCNLSEDARGAEDALANLDALRHHLLGKAVDLSIQPSHWETLWHQASVSTPGRFDVFSAGAQKVALMRGGGRDLIVSGHRDGVLRFWDSTTLREVGEGLRVHRGGIGGLIVAEQRLGSSVVVSGGVDRSLALSSLEAVGPVVMNRHLHDSEIDALGVVRLPTCGDVMVAGCRSGDLVFRRLEDGEVLGHYKLTGTQARDIASLVRGDFSSVWVATRDGQIREYRVAASHGGPVEIVETGATANVDSELWAISACLDSQGNVQVMTGGNDGFAYRWLWNRGATAGESTQAHEGGVYSIVSVNCGSPVTGSGFATGGGDGVVRVWESGGTSVAELDSAGMVGRINGLDAGIGRNGQVCVVAASSSSMGRVWTLPSRTLVGDYVRPSFYRINSISCSQDEHGNALILTCGDGNEILRWDARAGISERVIGPVFKDRVSGVASYSLSGRQMVVAGSYDGTILTWPLDDTERVEALAIEEEPVESLLVVRRPHGGAVLVTGYARGQITVRDLTTRRVTRTLQVAESVVLTLATPPESDESSLVVSGLDDGSVLAFDAARPEQAATPIARHSGAVRSLRCDVTGGELLVASAGDDDVLRVTGVNVLDLEPRAYWHRAGFRGRALTRLDVQGRLVLLGAGDSSAVSAWDFRNGSETCFSLALPDRPNQMATLANDEALFVLANGGMSLLRLNL